MKSATEKILEKLVACYYDTQDKRASTVPFMYTRTDSDIKELWLVAVKHLETLNIRNLK